MQLPSARNENILVQELKNEILIYDLLTNKACCLNETSAKVFNACGNAETFESLKKNHRFTDDLIHLSLDELKKNNLLKDEYASVFAGMSRREVIRKVGLASMIALPVVSGLVAPVAANATSGGCAIDGTIVPGTGDSIPEIAASIRAQCCSGRYLNFTFDEAECCSAPRDDAQCV